MALLLSMVAPLERLPQVVLACCAGKDVYMDVQGWHLYLKDASAGKGLKIAEALAQQLGSEMSQGKFQPQDLEGILKKVRAPFLLPPQVGTTQRCAVLWQASATRAPSGLAANFSHCCHLMQVPVSLGGGKETLSLFDVIPAAGIRDMQDILKDFERDI